MRKIRLVEVYSKGKTHISVNSENLKRLSFFDIINNTVLNDEKSMDVVQACRGFEIGIPKDAQCTANVEKFIKENEVFMFRVVFDDNSFTRVIAPDEDICSSVTLREKDDMLVFSQNV